VQAIAQPDATSLVLTTFGGPAEGAEPRRQHLLLSCRPASARVALLDAGRESLPSPPAFAQRARALLLPSRVAGAELLGEDRVLALALDAGDVRFELLLQILPQRSNLYLLGEGQRVLAALRPLAETRPELAPLQPWRAAASRPPSEGRDRFEDEPDGRFLFAIESHYAEAERAGELTQRRRAIEQALRREEKGLTRKLMKLDEELAEAEGASRLAREGELLKGVLARLRRGASQAVARDPETDTDVVIALDPSLSPAENLDRIFRRHRKAVRALAQAGSRREAIAAQLSSVRASLSELESIAALGEDPAAASALDAFSAQEAVSALVAKRAPSAPNRRERPDAERELAGRRFPARLAPRRYRTAGDLEVWVGRSDAGNDFLTTRLARGRDLFFHLDGAPGSHVILRTEGKLDPPSEALLDACELAVHFSKQRDATRADVHVVPIANVRKPRGAKPGLVTVHGGKTVHLRRTSARLERVLGDRIEE
jgi:predicted ribosome quality control (RQC) complex YloA/Tae2 family protein